PRRTPGMPVVTAYPEGRGSNLADDSLMKGAGQGTNTPSRPSASTAQSSLSTATWSTNELGIRTWDMTVGAGPEATKRVRAGAIWSEWLYQANAPAFKGRELTSAKQLICEPDRRVEGALVTYVCDAMNGMRVGGTRRILLPSQLMGVPSQYGEYAYVIDIELRGVSTTASQENSQNQGRRESGPRKTGSGNR